MAARPVRRGDLLAGGYVALVVVLAVASFGPRNATISWFPEGLLLALCLPALVPALPVVYLVGALAWNVTGADAGGPHAVVTAVYAVLFATVAAANVLLFRLAVRRRRSHGPGAGAPAGGGTS